MTWSAWTLNERQSVADPQQWHVYRGQKEDGKWKYDTRTYPRSLFAE
jgi:hypothetical protein